MRTRATLNAPRTEHALGLKPSCFNLCAAPPSVDVPAFTSRLRTAPSVQSPGTGPHSACPAPAQDLRDVVPSHRSRHRRSGSVYPSKKIQPGAAKHFCKWTRQAGRFCHCSDARKWHCGPRKRARSSRCGGLACTSAGPPVPSPLGQKLCRCGRRAGWDRLARHRSPGPEEVLGRETPHCERT